MIEINTPWHYRCVAKTQLYAGLAAGLPLWFAACTGAPEPTLGAGAPFELLVRISSMDEVSHLYGGAATEELESMTEVLGLESEPAWRISPAVADGTRWVSAWTRQATALGESYELGVFEAIEGTTNFREAGLIEVPTQYQPATDRPAHFWGPTSGQLYVGGPTGTFDRYDPRTFERTGSWPTDPSGASSQGWTPLSISGDERWLVRTIETDTSGGYRVESLDDAAVVASWDSYTGGYPRWFDVDALWTSRDRQAWTRRAPNFDKEPLALPTDMATLRSVAMAPGGERYFVLYIDELQRCHTVLGFDDAGTFSQIAEFAPGQWDECPSASWSPRGDLAILLTDDPLEDMQLVRASDGERFVKVGVPPQSITWAPDGHAFAARRCNYGDNAGYLERCITTIHHDVRVAEGSIFAPSVARIEGSARVTFAP